MRRLARYILFSAALVGTAVACFVDPPRAAQGPNVTDAALDDSVAPAWDAYTPPTIAAANWPLWASDGIDDLVSRAIGASMIPGCVVAVGNRKEILFLKAYGNRSLVPSRTPMTVDTIFDLASLTKPIATALSVVWLADRGLLDLDASVASLLPEFRGQRSITVRSLLLHIGGIQADLPLDDFKKNRAGIIRRVSQTVAVTPNTRFLYSDSGFIALDEIVRRVTGSALDTFSEREIFPPLGMTETRFNPPETWKPRIAPTELRNGEVIVGEVHDPRAYLMGGVAGHAGLFSTAKDLSQFATWLLGSGAPVLSPNGRRFYAAPHDVPGAVRALGWDVRSRYSINRPKLFSPRAFGHGGFTGTSLWIDPERDLYIVFLSNRVHPSGKGSSNALASAVGDIAAQAMGEPSAISYTPVDAGAAERSNGAALSDNGASSFSPGDAGGVISHVAAQSEVFTGIDVLERSHFKTLSGVRVALITNQTGRSKSGARTIDLLKNAPNVHLAAIFSPEHGLNGTLDEKVRDDIDDATGLRVFSLYGERFSPKPEQLVDIDTLVFDLQDVGTRFYTYVSTMRRAMEVAAREGLRFVVLDRPNPLGGAVVEGPVLDIARPNFVNHFPLPVRHGMTAGELALLFDAAGHFGTRLSVIPMSGWNPEKRWDELGMEWRAPSPNLRTPIEALLYPGVGLVEATNVSVGRGTATPFEVVGAPWIDKDQLASELRSAHLEGVSVEPTEFSPTGSTFRGLTIGGVRFRITDARLFRPIRLGLELSRALAKLYAGSWEIDKLDNLLGSAPLVEMIRAGKPLDEIEASYKSSLDAFMARRAKYLLYPRPL